jgi:hypothetical protein
MAMRRQLFQIMINVTTVVGSQTEEGANTDDTFGTVTRTYDGQVLVKTIWQLTRIN